MRDKVGVFFAPADIDHPVRQAMSLCTDRARHVDVAPVEGAMIPLARFVLAPKS
jgi:hypothetical protein